MNAILKYHIRQILNYWFHLKFRIRIEIIILFVIFYSFFTDRFVRYFNQILLQPDLSPTGLTISFLHILMMIVIFSTPYIYFNLFPKQSGLINISIYPLKKSDVLALLMIYFVKYQIIIILIATPIYTALALSTGFLMLVYILFFTCSFVFLSALMVLILASKGLSHSRILSLYFLFFLIYMKSFAFLYKMKNFYFI